MRGRGGARRKAIEFRDTVEEPRNTRSWAGVSIFGRTQTRPTREIPPSKFLRNPAHKAAFPIFVQENFTENNNVRWPRSSPPNYRNTSPRTGIPRFLDGVSEFDGLPPRAPLPRAGPLSPRHTPPRRVNDDDHALSERG